MTELAADGIPVTMTCRVLKLCRQDYYRWRNQPVTDALLDEAHIANAIFDAHVDDPEFGYRFIADEVRAVGFEVCDRTVWRICRDNGWWSVFGKKKRGCEEVLRGILNSGTSAAPHCADRRARDQGVAA